METTLTTPTSSNSLNQGTNTVGTGTNGNSHTPADVHQPQPSGAHIPAVTTTQRQNPGHTTNVAAHNPPVQTQVPPSGTQISSPSGAQIATPPALQTPANQMAPTVPQFYDFYPTATAMQYGM